MGKHINSILVENEEVLMEAGTCYLSLGLGILFVVPVIRTFLNSKKNEMAVTNHRVLLKQGLIMKDMNELALQNIRQVNLKQSIFGRILGYGDIEVVSNSGDGFSYTGIKKAKLFKETIDTARLK